MPTLPCTKVWGSVYLFASKLLLDLSLCRYADNNNRKGCLCGRLFLFNLVVGIGLTLSVGAK